MQSAAWTCSRVADTISLNHNCRRGISHGWYNFLVRRVVLQVNGQRVFQENCTRRSRWRVLRQVGVQVVFENCSPIEADCLRRVESYYNGNDVSVYVKVDSIYVKIIEYFSSTLRYIAQSHPTQTQVSTILSRRFRLAPNSSTRIHGNLLRDFHWSTVQPRIFLRSFLLKGNNHFLLIKGESNLIKTVQETVLLESIDFKWEFLSVGTNDLDNERCW